MGRVFEARHAGTGRRLAVKLIQGGDPANAGALARLQVEARAAGAIESEHIAEVLDVGSDEASGAAYIVMEHLVGEDLQHLLARLGPLPPPLCLRLAAHACLGLQKAHAAGVIHRDIKPANLFLAEREGGERVLKILDFGIAKLKPSPLQSAGAAAGKQEEAQKEEGTRLTQTGSMIGTPLYMSPEQVRGQRTIDHRADIWSLGVVLFEALTGRPPHLREAVGDLIVAICVDRAPLVTTFAPWVPPGVATIVERALTIDPAARFQRVEDFLDALLALLPGPPVIHAAMVVPADAAPPASLARPGAPTVLVDSQEPTSLDVGLTAQRAALGTVEVQRAPTPQPVARADNLPAPLTSFVGREPEIAEARRLVAAGRLVSLLGPGGTGKTRLAIRVASELRETFEDGVVFVDLSPLAEGEAIPAAIAGAAGVREEPGQALSATLLRQLRPRRLLLVLDNCEHVVGACAELVEQLLSACPGLRILATSREALAVDGEAVLGLAPLQVPAPPGSSGPAEAEIDLARVAESEAVRLFVDRARSAQPGFQLTAQNAPAVAHICRRLDGIPLALELAAARLRGMSAEQIAARIDDRFGLLDNTARRTTVRRQRTLRALIDWSHDLLTEPERAVLRRLAVFQGGFPQAAAEAACAWEGDPLGIRPEEVLDLVAQLVGRSLVVAEDPGGAARFRLLETIRQYANEKLGLSGEGPVVRDRHLGFFLGLAEQAEPTLRTGSQLEGIQRLDAEHDNLRAALDHAHASPDRAEIGLRLAGALGWFWWLRGHHAEGSGRLARALAQAAGAPPALRGRALCLSAQLSPGLKQAAPAWSAGLAAYREAADGWGIAFALLGAAEQSVQDGDLAAALGALEEGLERARATGDAWIVARLLQEHGKYHHHRLELERAVPPLREGLALARETGDRWLVGHILHTLGKIWGFQGEWQESLALLQESLKLQRALGSKTAIADTLCTLGGALQCLGRYGESAVCYEETLGLARAIGSEELTVWAHLNLADNALLQSDLRKARHALWESFKRWQTARKEHLAWGLLVLAEVAYREGKPAQAMRFFGAQRALEEAYALNLHPASRVRFQRLEDAIRAASGEAAEASWRLGRGMGLAETVRAALAYLAA